MQVQKKQGFEENTCLFDYTLTNNNTLFWRAIVFSKDLFKIMSLTL